MFWAVVLHTFGVQVKAPFGGPGTGSFWGSRYGKDEGCGPANWMPCKRPIPKISAAGVNKNMGKAQAATRLQHCLLSKNMGPANQHGGAAEQKSTRNEGRDIGDCC